MPGPRSQTQADGMSTGVVEPGIETPHLDPGIRRDARRRVESREAMAESEPMSEVIIRPATDADADALAAIGRQTFIDTFVDVGGFAIPYPAEDLEEYLGSSFSAAAFREKLREPGGAWWVAERDGDLLAFANTGPNGLPHPDARPSHAELRRLYVSKTAQGLGLGTKLLKIALDWMEAHTDGPLWIGVWSGNLKAQKLYAAYGFEKAGEYEYPVGRWRDHEFILRRG
jgi:ribosomal protein S18 acetylase RimI-like enzyme